MQKKISILIACALLLVLFSPFFAISHAQAVVSGNGSDNFHYNPPPPVTPKPPQVTPPSAPAPQVAAAPPPANNEYVLQRAARN
jgi:hypothetical protein